MSDAIRARDLKKALTLIEGDAHINERDHGGWTPFILACENGLLEVAKVLKEKGESPTQESSFGWTAMTQASEHGHVEVVKWLIEVGASVKDVSNNDKLTPMFLALQNGHVDVAEVLLAHGAKLDDVNHEKTPTIINTVYYGQLESLKWLVSKGADLKVRCKNYGNSILLQACKGGHIEIVRYLKSIGQLKLDDVNNYSSNAMVFAVNAPSLPLVELLFSYGWKLPEGFQSPLVGVHDVKTLDVLLDHGLVLDTETNFSSTPLSYAAYNGQLDVVKRMIERGADPKRRDKDGKNAYDMAVYGTHNQGTAEVAAFLTQFN